MKKPIIFFLIAFLTIFSFPFISHAQTDLWSVKPKPFDFSSSNIWTGSQYFKGMTYFDSILVKVYQLDTGNVSFTKNFYLPRTTNTNKYGIFHKDGNRFLYEFTYGNNGSVTVEGKNLFLGEYAGNLNMGSTATETYHSSSNLGIGGFSLYNNTKGYYNNGFGYATLYSNTEGYYNIALGTYSLYNNTTGNYNTGLGYGTLFSMINGSSNTAIGHFAGTYLTDESGTIKTDTAKRPYYSNPTYTQKTTGNYSVYIGANTKALADGTNNEVVIGYNTTGNGSNTVTIGNSNITGTYLKNVVLDTIKSDLTITRDVLVDSTLTVKSYKQKSVVAIADSTINCNLSNTFSKTLGANQRFVFTNLSDGQTINIAVTNTASNYTVTWVTPTGGLDIKWQDSVTPVQTIGAKTDVWSFIRVGTTIYGSVIQNF